MSAPTPLPWARHIVCFWKQNDLGLFGRRPDRWIDHWRQDPTVEKILVFEPPMDGGQLQQMLHLSTTQGATSGSEFRLLLNQALSKHQGLLDDDKVQYKTYIAPPDKAGDHPAYLRWVLQTLDRAHIQSPLVMLWPACFVNESLLHTLHPGLLVTDLIDDQRLAPGQAALIPTINAQYKRFIAQSQRVITPSRALAQNFSNGFGRTVEYLPNTLLRPSLPPAAAGALPTAQRGHGRPVVGYVGNLRSITDPGPLLQTLQQHTETTFWFVGQTHGAPFYRHAHRLPNCRFWGTLVNAQIRHLLAQMDAVILPFKDEPPPFPPGSTPTLQRQGRLPLVPLQGLDAGTFARLLQQALAMAAPQS